MIPDFEQTLGTQLTGVAALAAAFSAWGARARLTNAQIFQVNLVLEELVTNVIVHGLGVGQPGWVRLRVRYCGECLALDVRDNAPPFDPFQVPPPKLTDDLDTRSVGGLGIHFVRTLMDDWSYARIGNENVVALRKMLGGTQ